MPGPYLMVQAMEIGGARPIFREVRRVDSPTKKDRALVQTVLGRARLVVCGVNPCKDAPNEIRVVAHFWRANDPAAPMASKRQRIFARRSALGELIQQLAAEPFVGYGYPKRQGMKRRGKPNPRRAWYDGGA